MSTIIWALPAVLDGLIIRKRKIRKRKVGWGRKESGSGRSRLES